MSRTAADAGMAAAFYCLEDQQNRVNNGARADILPEESTMNFEGEMT